MKFLSALVTLAVGAGAHSVMQQISVNGKPQGYLKGVRAPDSTDPITDVDDAHFSCNKHIAHKDSSIITVPAGASVGAWWGHWVQETPPPNDPEQPIADSHKGPIQVYLARVDDAVNAVPDGSTRWFKISEFGYNQTHWAVDVLREPGRGGWWYFRMPECVRDGQYLMRVEILALHEANEHGKAQFYMECAQYVAVMIRVTGGGSSTGSHFATFPGTYKADDGGILVDIYNHLGMPDNNHQDYQIPGPKKLTC
ncbi:putative endo-beta-1,4-glucanase D [Colletotrichum trifolii]|uniref:lytic cellulose monooxygenase (C4-dehydrogenating) n=1 Tax=Colletotrichum trifolii TaxID=5466 RepID=A0A4R8QQD0_COLTR|nr:putative endo-beta-1,4-glucanase D [Colletotrichum trifolii]